MAPRLTRKRDRSYVRMSDRRRLFCVGMAKTGTHSIAALFGNSVRARHEANAEDLLPRILQFLDGRLTDGELTSYIHAKDEELRLDVDSSQLNFFTLDILIREFPGARFLLTIRDPYSWLNSFIDDSLRRITSEAWVRLREYRFGAGTFSHPAEEQVLKEHGLYTLDGYLSYWRSHNDKVLSLVPREQLLVVRTDEISDQVYELADFAGLPRSAVRRERSHAFRNSEKFGILQKVDPAYLQSKITFHCKPLMDRFFPDIHGAQV